MTQNDFFICKAEEWGVAVATAIDDNAADKKSGKSLARYLLFAVLAVLIIPTLLFLG